MAASQAPMTASPFNPVPSPAAQPRSTRLRESGFALVLFCPTVSLLLVGLRMYSRARTRQIWLDDVFLCAAMILVIPETAFTYMFAKTSFAGLHIQDVPRHDPTVALRWHYLSQIFYAPVLPLVKASALTFLLRLGCRKPGVRRAILALNGVNLVVMVVTTLVTALQCSPASLNWDFGARFRASLGGGVQGGRGGGIGKCIDRGAFYLSTALVSIVTDLLVLALPFWIVLGLQLPPKMKVAVLGVFLLGSIVTLASIVRFYYLYAAFYRPPGPDPTYSVAYVVATIEINLAIICTCAPALRGLARDWLARLLPWAASAARRKGPRPPSPERSTFTSWSVRSTLKAGQASQLRRQLGRAAVKSAEDDDDGAAAAAAPSGPPARVYGGGQGGRVRDAGCGLAGSSSAGVCSPSPYGDEQELPAVAEPLAPGRRRDRILCRTDVSVRFERTGLPQVILDLGRDEDGGRLRVGEEFDRGMRTSVRLSRD